MIGALRLNFERKVSAFDPVKFDAVIPQYFPATVRRHLLMEKLLGGFGKVRVAVRVVAGENQVVVADQLADVADICFVAFAANNALAFEVFTGLDRQQRRVMLTELLPVPVHALQP